MGWLNSSRRSSARWWLGGQEPGDGQSQVEAGGGRRWMNSSSWRLEGSTVEMNSILWSPVLRYATLLPMNRTPVSTVALQHKSVSSVLWYATPLPINRTLVSTVVGPFPPFCGTPDPSRSTGPRSECRRSVSSVVRYARPRFHRLFRPSPPDEHDHAFRSDPAGWIPRVPLPPHEHDAFCCLPMNTTCSVASP